MGFLSLLASAPLFALAQAAIGPIGLIDVTNAQLAPDGFSRQ
jgi:hypothetical protein